MKPTKMDSAILAEAFASEHRATAMDAGNAVVRMLGSRAIWERFAVQSDGQAVLIPVRLYFASDRLRLTEGDEAWRFARALQTRSSDGFLRQRAARDLLTDFQPWAAPFIIALIGEYVVEILDDIAAALTPEMTMALAAFIAENPAYWNKTKRRVMSYWNVYYRYGGWNAVIVQEQSGWNMIRRRVMRCLVPSYWEGSVTRPSYRRDQYIGFKLIDRLEQAVAGAA